MEGVLSWEQLCERVSAGRILELKNILSLQRGRVTGMSLSRGADETRILYVGVKLYEQQGKEWYALGFPDFDIKIEKDTPRPLTYVDGCIRFVIAAVDYTIYPVHTPIDCP